MNANTKSNTNCTMINHRNNNHDNNDNVNSKLAGIRAKGLVAGLRPRPAQGVLYHIRVYYTMIYY